MANFEAALRDINSPDSPDMIPDVQIWYDCDTLEANYEKLAGRIGYWNDKYASGSSKEKKNIQQILGILNGKATAYQNQIAKDCGTLPPATTTGGGMMPPVNPTINPTDKDVTKPDDITNNNNTQVNTGAATTGTTPAATAGTGMSAKTKKALIIAGIAAAVLLIGALLLKKHHNKKISSAS